MPYDKENDMFETEFADYVLSGHAMLRVATHEKERAFASIIKVSEDIERHAFVWSIVGGWRDVNGKEVASAQNPQASIQAIYSMDENAIFVLKDFAPYLAHDTYPEFDIVIGWLDEIRQTLSATGRTIVFLGPEFKPPESLKQSITELNFDLPDKTQIEQAVRFICDGVTTSKGEKFKPDEQCMGEVVSACKGMTQSQVMDRTALAIRKTKKLGDEAIQILLHEKASVIRATGILQYSEPPSGGLGMVGGLDELKKHILLDRPCFTDEAKEFGIEPPKGILLVGVPGGGKTLVSLAVASEFKFPLIKMDVGDIMSKWVGESESNMTDAIRLLEGISPCVLMIDECEKGFGGLSGDNDGGTSSRVFGKFIKWMNDKTHPIYIVATANNVNKLPPEFARTGRFDAIFGVDLPTETEREAIIKIHIAKRNRDPEQFNSFTKETDGFTGSDIEQAVKLAIKIAFQRKSKLTNEHLAEGISSIVPLIKTEPQKIESIRSWCKTHAKAANSIITQTAPLKSKRVNLSGGNQN